MTPRTDVDLVVVGAGPAGCGAAVEASRKGLSVLLIDENTGPGGQIHRQLSGEPRRFSPKGPSAEARQLLAELGASDVEFLTEATAWGSFAPNTLEVVRGGTNLSIQYRTIVVASGAFDRPFPVPGWTLPGVFTAGGAQALLKSQGSFPGDRILLAGTGPLQLVVASQLARAGAGISAVVEAVPLSTMMRRVHSLVKGGRLIIDGLRYRFDVAMARIPWLSPAVVVEIGGRHHVEYAKVARLGPGWRPLPGTETTFEVDAVCLGYGLIPSTELVRSLGCKVKFDPNTATWVPYRDDNGETSVEGVFAVGDGVEISGAGVALDEGRLAGRVIAARLNPASRGERVDRGTRRLRRRLRSRRRFAETIRQVFRVPHDYFAEPGLSTVICRCEDVSDDVVRTAIREGASDLPSLKNLTRIGMGPCQGKMCTSTAMAILSHWTKEPMETLKPLPVRPPVRLVPISDLLQGSVRTETSRAESRPAPSTHHYGRF